MQTPMQYGPGDTIDFNQVKRILVIKLRHHGDVLLSSPVFQVLKNHYPHLQVDALVYEETLPMLAFHPAIHQVHVIDRKWRKQGTVKHMQHEWGLIQNLKQQQYDVVIHLTESWRGAIICRLLKPRYSIVKKYARRQSGFWLKSFSHHYPVPVKPRHTVEVHLDALRRVGLQPKIDERQLVVQSGEQAEHAVRARLAEQGVDGTYVVVHPTSRWMFKCWSVSAMASVINQLCESGHKVVLSAAPDKKELAMMADIKRLLDSNHSNNVVDFSGSLSLYDLIALINHAELMIGVDSVPMHIAAATQTPLIALFGPSGDLEWGPWQAKSQVITSDQHSCRPCGMDGCAGSKVSDCLQQISVSTVLNAVPKVINL